MRTADDPIKAGPAGHAPSTDGFHRRVDAGSDARSAATATRRHPIGAAGVASGAASTAVPDDRIRWTSPHMLVGFAAMILIAVGWVSVDELDLTPAEGAGYALGITGMLTLVLLLAYSARKRIRPLRHAGQLRNWFEAHLVLGLLAPVAILYHANFRVESANAAIALTCMLVVAGSGIGGRYLYGRLHRGLAGELRSVAGFQRAAQERLRPAQAVLETRPEVLRLLARFEERSAGLTSGLIRSLPAMSLRIRARFVRHGLLSVFRQRGCSAADLQCVDVAVTGCLDQLCRAGELRLFTQLFALWHALHIPLTVILFLSAIVHIVAVHLY